MTKFEYIVTALGLLAFALQMLRVYRYYLHQDLSRIDSLNIWSAKFTEICRDVFRDPQTPPAFIISLKSMNLLIGRRGTARALFQVLDERNRNKFESQITTSDEAFLQYLKNKDAMAIAVKYIDAMHAAMLCLSYSDFFYGVRARALLSEQFSKDYSPTLAKCIVLRIDALPARSRHLEAVT